MLCPRCNSKSKVVDSRPRVSDRVIRRRRVCLKCGHIWTTYEAEAEGFAGLEAFNKKVLPLLRRLKEIC